MSADGHGVEPERVAAERGRSPRRGARRAHLPRRRRCGAGARILSDRPPRLETLLDEIAGEKGVLGAALVSRDGLAVRASGKLAHTRETFSAMSATVMGAAEIALGELDGGKTAHLVVTTDRIKLLILGATRDLLLVVSTQADTPHERLLPRLEAAARTVALVASGG